MPAQPGIAPASQFLEIANYPSRTTLFICRLTKPESPASICLSHARRLCSLVLNNQGPIWLSHCRRLYSLTLITHGQVPDNWRQPCPPRTSWDCSNAPILSLLTLPCTCSWKPQQSFPCLESYSAWLNNVDAEDQRKMGVEGRGKGHSMSTVNVFHTWTMTHSNNYLACTLTHTHTHTWISIKRKQKSSE